MDENPFKNKESKEYTKKMHDCVVDYSHDITTLMFAFKKGGVAAVQEELQHPENTLGTFTDYLNNRGYKLLDDKEMENAEFKKNISVLEQLGKELKEANPLTEEKFLDVQEKVMAIIRPPQQSL